MRNARGEANMRRFLAAFVSFAMICTSFVPTLALAAEDSVWVQQGEGASEQSVEVSGLTIGGVDAPATGVELDSSATVKTAEGETWDVGVLWVNSNLDVATVANEGDECLPIIAFYTPETYKVKADDKGGYTVYIAPDLQKLFGSEDVITVYDAATGITYILPSSLRGFFNRGEATGNATDEAAPASDAQSADASEATPKPGEGAYAGSNASMVEIFCSRTARDALGESDLQWLVELIVNKLQPQAVNLLLEKFPAFSAAAQNNELGSSLGLYVYYKQGDKDGDEAHETVSPGSLASVSWNYSKDKDGTLKYGYVLSVDSSSLTKKDSEGKLVLIREGYDFEIFQNTLVHELFHALMDDYNRPGMAGTTKPELAILDTNKVTPAQSAEWKATRYPTWFMEGTASAVENNLQYRASVFNALTAAVKVGKTNYAAGSPQAILYNYINSKNNYNLGYSYKTDSAQNSTARYVTGYLAVLYLGELAAQKDASIGTSVTRDKNGNVTNINSQNIRLGLNSILERMHKGETLDQVINDLSPIDPSDGQKYYTNADTFEDRFVLGFQYKRKDGSKYYNVNPSTEFVASFMAEMAKVTASTQYGANGSILDDFYRDYRTPLDPNKVEGTKILSIVESNTYVDSTVPMSTALAGGGTSKSGKPKAGTKKKKSKETKATEEVLPQAAKDEAQAEDDATTTDAAPEQAEDAQAADKGDADKGDDVTTTADETEAAEPATEDATDEAPAADAAPEQGEAAEPVAELTEAEVPAVETVATEPVITEPVTTELAPVAE